MDKTGEMTGPPPPDAQPQTKAPPDNLSAAPVQPPDTAPIIDPSRDSTETLATIAVSADDIKQEQTETLKTELPPDPAEAQLRRDKGDKLTTQIFEKTARGVFNDLDGLTPAEMKRILAEEPALADVYFYALIAYGIKAGDIKPGDPGIKVQNPIRVEMEDGKGVNVQKITSCETASKDGEQIEVFKCTITDKDNQVQENVEIRREDLAKAQLHASADAIGKVFSPDSSPAPVLGDIMTKYAKGDIGEVSPEQLEVLEKQLEALTAAEAPPPAEQNSDTINRANQEITKQIVAYGAKLQDVKNFPEGSPQRRNAERYFAKLQTVAIMNGEVGAWLKLKVLEDLQNDNNRIDFDLMNKLAPEAAKGKQAVVVAFIKSGMEEQKARDHVGNLENNPKGLLAVLEDPKIGNNPEIVQAIFGDNYNEQTVERAARLLLDAHVGKEEAERRMELWKKSGKGLLWALLILLAAPVVAAGAATVVVGGAAMQGARS